MPLTFDDVPALTRLEPRPDVHVTSLGRAMLITGRDGRVAGGRTGLFVCETRVVSRYVWTIDDHDPDCTAYTDAGAGRALGYWITVPPRPPDEPVEPGGLSEKNTEQTLALELDRHLGPVVIERVRVTNYTLRSTRFTLALEIDADFADAEEAREGTREQRGRRERTFELANADGATIATLRFGYHAEHDYDHPGHHGHATLDRSVALRFVGFPRARFDEQRSRVCFDLAMRPGEVFAARVEIEPGREGFLNARSPRGSWRAAHRATVTRMSAARSPHGGELTATVLRALAQARIDLASMRMFDAEPIGAGEGWTVVAGVPSYTGVFGRDTLTAAWQAAMLDHGLLIGTLDELAKWQGTRRDDWREESPGRMLHEAHTSPLAELCFHPRGRSYSGITSSAFFPVTLASAWHWHGDRALVERHVDAALRALRWRDEECRHDDGFTYYHRRSPQGLVQQGWKDSRSSMVDARGHVVEPPIATCEEQGLSYWARVSIAEMLAWLGQRDLARRMMREARELKARFDERFWMESERFYAMALGPNGEPLRTIASNPGHCIATGIVPDARVRGVADRLLANDLFSGWGIRTLSSEHPAFNPFSYHRGTVWPVENGTFVLAFMRYGLHEHAQRLARALFEACTLFPWARLPELIGGQTRDADHPAPALYPDAQSPQAWSSTALVIAVQALLGLYPYAPLHLLLVDPHLPEWLPELCLERMRVGNARVTLTFWRDPRTGRTRYRVDELEGKLHVVRQPSPWSLTEGPLSRARDLLESLAH